MDSIDLDALLIGALYSELTPADEARLTAHLESHPADRTALADLTRTRTQLRDSRLFAVQVEPPQSVLTVLMREAGRRVPRRESEGWVQRFLRAMTAHPAMAAAMTLVLVVGVAGALYMRHEDGFGAPPPDMMNAKEETEATVAASAPAGAAVPAAGSAAFGASAGASGEGRAPAEPAPVADDGAAQPGFKGGEQEKSAAVTRGAAGGGVADARSAYAMAPAAPVAPAKHLKQGIEVRGGVDLLPKELPADELAKADRDGVADSKDAPGGAAHAMAAPTPSPSASPSASEAPAAVASNNSNKLRLREQRAEPAAAPAPPDESRSADGWAQKQREQVIAYVRANNCRAAASAANEIYNRAPDYYAANVEVDRSIKPCLAYLNTERERTDRAKASAKRVEAGPAAPAPIPSRK